MGNLAKIIRRGLRRRCDQLRRTLVFHIVDRLVRTEDDNIVGEAVAQHFAGLLLEQVGVEAVRTEKLLAG